MRCKELIIVVGQTHKTPESIKEGNLMTSRERVLIIGLDGGTFDLIEPWIAEGYLPNLSRLMTSGCYGRLTSTLQPTTAPAWVTCMTGVNQGKHGLYDFVRRRSEEYGLELTNASHVAAPTIFDIVSQCNRRVVSVNVPFTSPPRPVNGLMIGGPFAAAVTRDLVYPPVYYDTLKRIAPDYFVLPDYDPRAADPMTDYATKLLKGVELRERLCLHILKTESWDLFATVFMATDEAQHAFWHCQAADEGTPPGRYRYVIRDIYNRVDQAIGALLTELAMNGLATETTVIVVSDHGAGPFRWMINLNRWLADTGHLTFRTDRADVLRQWWTEQLKQIASLYRRHLSTGMRAAVRRKLGTRRFDGIKGDFESILLTSNVDWDHTRAYALGAGGNIFVNLKGREPAGTVEPGGEYERVCQEVTDSLMNLSDPDTGETVVKHVFRREDLYNGPYVDLAPDLIIQWKDYSCWGRGRYDSSESVFQAQRRFDFSDKPLTGSHRLDGIFIVDGPGVRSNVKITGARLMDVAPTALKLLGIEPGHDLDGQVLQSVFSERVADDAPQFAPSDGLKHPRQDCGYDPEEERILSEHLRSLGYL